MRNFNVNPILICRVSAKLTCRLLLTKGDQMETIYTMSQKEIKRLEIIQKVLDRKMRQKQAAEALSISVGQIQRLLIGYKKEGPAGIMSKKRGKPSNNRKALTVKETAIFLIRQNYADFGPTLVTEKLAELHSLKLSVETVRRLMTNAGLWLTRKQKTKRAYQPRHRRSCYGELIQIDGSEHEWFEDRGPKCNLLVYVDDATSKLMQLRFVPDESTFAYFEATKDYMHQHGKPIAFYSDKHGIFRVNAKNAKGGDTVTQFGRALLDLNIDIINANTCEAKGRVERANLTLQDRLVKEMRLKGISNIQEANSFLPKYIHDYNNRFGKTPAMDHNIHRPLQEHELNALDDIFCWQEDRTLSECLTLLYDKVKYILEDNIQTRQLRRKRVTVFDYPDGSIKIKYQGKEFKYRTFDKLRRVNPGAIVEGDRLANVLLYIKKQQDLRELETPSRSCPSRTHMQSISS